MCPLFIAEDIILHAKGKRDENEEITQTELDYLIDTRVSGGVWEITWSWFENNEKYPKEYAISENWWKADKAISVLRHLRNFGRICG